MEHVIQNAYGGATKTAEPPQIHALMLKLRAAIKSLAAEKKAGVMFPVRGAKDLNQKLANALNELDLLAPVISQKFHHFDVEKIPPYPSRDGGTPRVAFRTLLHCECTVRMIAPDGSYVDMVGSGHGGDGDDKAGGKASTYAWKDAILKGLTIPHEDMIDTDDEQPGAAGTTGVATTPPGPVRNSAPVAKPPGPERKPESDSSDGLSKFLARITASTTLSELEALRAEIKNGTVDLKGSDRLKASEAYVTRKQEIVGTG